jgi:hypothetical protein
MLGRLTNLHAQGALHFFGEHVALHDSDAFRAFLRPLYRAEWVVYAKRPFASPEQVLSYLARYTHRVAIANSRLAAIDGEQVSFSWKDYRREGHERYRLMTLAGDEFIRLPAARAARRLSPHPPLRPVRQRRPHRQCRHRATLTRCGPACG